LALSGPSSAQAGSLTPLDNHILTLWRGRRRILARDEPPPPDWRYDPRYDAQEEIEEHVADSLHALGATLIVYDDKIDGFYDEYVRAIFRASLAAIRPQLKGEIAEDADRLLARGLPKLDEGSTSAERRQRDFLRGFLGFIDNRVSELKKEKGPEAAEGIRAYKKYRAGLVRGSAPKVAEDLPA
jgi:hypothetical protein